MHFPTIGTFVVDSTKFKLIMIHLISTHPESDSLNGVVMSLMKGIPLFHCPHEKKKPLKSMIFAAGTTKHLKNSLLASSVAGSSLARVFSVRSNCDDAKRLSDAALSGDRDRYRRDQADGGVARIASATRDQLCCGVLACLLGGRSPTPLCKQTGID